MAHLENCVYAGSQIKACVECEFVVNEQAPVLGPNCLQYDPSEEKPHGIGRKSVHSLKTT